jgi:hypothetical protein
MTTKGQDPKLRNSRRTWALESRDGGGRVAIIGGAADSLGEAGLVCRGGNRRTGRKQVCERLTRR